MARNLYLDYLKGFLILLVTLGHTLQFAIYQNSEFWNDPIFKFIYMFHMPLFIGVSGYLSYTSVEKKDWLEIIFSRARSYLIPILVWSTFFKLFLFFSGNTSSLFTLIVDILKYSTQTLWFLWALFACLLFTIIIKKISTHNFWPIYLASFPLSLLLPEVGNMHLFKYVYPFFQIGYFLASKPNLKIKPVYAYIAFSLTVISYLLWSNDSYIYLTKMELTLSNSQNIIIRYLAGLFSCLCVSHAIYYLFLKSSLYIKKIFFILGKYTLQIYIIQNFAFMAVLHYSKLYIDTPKHYLELILVAFLFTILMSFFCILAGKIISKNNFLNMITFGNFK